ncbi:MAG TPA: hypothetical protein VKQ32_20350, partial [Polyangia bacterium]|nr:hypothetical protein [Polyangia bacterium]
AVVVFEHDSAIYANRYSYSQQQWSGATSISITPGAAYAQPMVAVDGTGQFWVAWCGAVGAATTGVWWSMAPDGLNWMPDMPLASTLASEVVISVNSQGDVIVGWNEKMPGSSGNQQAATTIRKANTWGPIDVMKPGDDTNKRNPAVAMGPTGETFAVWEQVDNGQNSIWVRQNPGNGWMPAAPLEMYNAAASSAPAIAINSHGVAIVTYVQLTASGTAQLLSQRYTGGVWGPPLLAGTAPGIDTTSPPSVTLDDNGVATAAWSAGNAQSIYNVQVNMTLASSSNWGLNPMAAETDDMANGTTSNATMPMVRGDGNGAVFVVWRKRAASGVFDIWAAHYVGGQLQSVMPLEPFDVDSAFNPVVGVNGSGVAVAAWYYGGNEQDVWANIWR